MEKQVNKTKKFMTINTVIKAINDEPELPGEMPDEIYQAVNNDKDALTELVRITVRETKKGILKRLMITK